WQAKGLDWSKNLRSLIVQHRKSSQEWQFNENQLKILRTYHDANKLLVECLNNAKYVSPLVKNQIESTLLSPQEKYTT
ncbi:MAG: NACHT C-terminal helical domain 2-containing protein, partial [Pseudanabaena sp.]